GRREGGRTVGELELPGYGCRRRLGGRRDLRPEVDVDGRALGNGRPGRVDALHEALVVRVGGGVTVEGVHVELELIEQRLCLLPVQADEVFRDNCHRVAGRRRRWRRGGLRSGRG